MWGFQLSDEPSAKHFSNLSAWSASIGARRPDALRFINLLPSVSEPRTAYRAFSLLNGAVAVRSNYAPGPGFSGDGTNMTYGDYVASFIKTVQPQIL